MLLCFISSHMPSWAPFSLPLHRLQKWVCLGFYLLFSWILGEKERFWSWLEKAPLFVVEAWESLETSQPSGFPLSREPGTLRLLRISSLARRELANCSLKWIASLRVSWLFSCYNQFWCKWGKDKLGHVKSQRNWNPGWCLSGVGCGVRYALGGSLHILLLLLILMQQLYGFILLSGVKYLWVECPLVWEVMTGLCHSVSLLGFDLVVQMSTRSMKTSNLR